MAPIRNLIDTINSLPGKAARKNLVSVLDTYGKLSAVAAEALVGSIASVNLAAEVFTDVGPNVVSTQIAQVRRASESLRTKISQNVESIETESVKNLFVSLRQKTEDSIKSLNQAWKNAVEKKVSASKGLIDAIDSAGLAKAKGLKTTLAKIEAEASTLPSNDADVSRIKSLLEEFDVSFAELNLSGEIGKFLIAVAQGAGDPRAFRDPEVVKFIEDNNLWHVFKIGLK